MRAVQPVPTLLPANAPGTAPAPDPQERPAPGAPLAALLGAVALAAIFARVALLNLTTALTGGDLDGYNNLWGMWWLKYALFTLHRNPFYDNYIYYPTGVSLYFHTLNPINGLVLAPIDQFIGYVPAMNLLFVGLLAVDTFCAWLFLRDLVGNPWAAFGGAAIYTYAQHFVVENLNAGQSERLSTEWLPLYLFFLYRALYGRPLWTRAGILVGRDTRRWRLWAGLAVLALIGSSLADWQYTLIAVFITLLYCAFLLCTRRTRREKAILFGKFALVGGLYALIITPPLVLPAILDALANPWLSVGYQSVLHATDLLDILGPGTTNPGYLACLVAGIGLVAAWRVRGLDRETAMFWLLAALLFWTMALGPTLILGGTNTNIPLPYGVLDQLPIFSIGRDPTRYTLIGRLGAGVLVAYGLTWIAERGLRIADFRAFGATFRNRLVPEIATARPNSAIRNPQSAIVVLLVVAFLAVDLGGWFVEAGGVRADPPAWPPFYQQLAADPDTYTLLELPLFTEKGRGEDHYQAYQAIHHKQRFDGRISRDRKLTNPNNPIKTSSLLRNLWMLGLPQLLKEGYPARDFLQRTDYATQGLAILNYYKVRYIVVYKDALDADWNEAAFQRILQQVLGPGVHPYYEDDLMRVYQVPQGPPAANPLTLDAGEGWYNAETRPDGTTFRWANNTGGQVSQFYSLNLGAAPVAATLRFTILPYNQQPRTVAIALNGKPIITLHLQPQDGETPEAVDLTLPPGDNTITLATPEAPLPTTNPHDARLLSFSMYNVVLQAK